MKEKSISDDADELLGITFVLAFTNSLLTFCKMALLDLFCEKKRVKYFLVKDRMIALFA